MTTRKRQKLPETKRILLAEEDVKAARRLLSLLASEEIDQEERANARARPLQRARTELRLRHRRVEIFGDRFAAEPPFAILLALYATEPDQPSISISGLAELALLNNGTALRWVDVLAEENWISRHPDPEDGRKVLLRLTSNARDALDELFAEE